MSERPVILIGSPNNPQWTGDGVNGGVKTQNLLSLLLRDHGYESYFVSFDGSKIDWLMRHTDYISVDTARQWKEQGRNLKFVTTWLWSAIFFELTQRYFLWDEELGFSSEYHLQRGILDQHMRERRIINLATHSRTIQSWYMATYGATPVYLPLWSADYWKPCAEKRVTGRIGYFGGEEGDTHDIEVIRQHCAEHGLSPEFIQLGGAEMQCLNDMQSCDLYVALGRGKHPLWGEGCNLSGLEAQHAGCVVVMYDTLGIREYLHDGWNGYVEPIGRADMLAGRIIELLQNKAKLEAMRLRSVDLAQGYFNADQRWDSVKEFLQLEAD